MKKIEFKTQKPKISINQINSFEQEYSQYNIQLPNDYKYFLINNSNGGRPIQRIYWDEKEELELGIAFFYSINEGNYPLNKMIENIYIDETIPEGYFPFASNGGSGQYVFSMKDSDFGCIYIVYSDSIEPFKICNSFEEFINRLEED